MNRLFHKGSTSGENSLTFKQVEKLRYVLDKLEDKVLIELAIATGIRRADIVAIERKNIDFANNKLTFKQNKKRNYHTVYLPTEIMNLLKMFTEIYRSKYLFPSHIKNKNHLSSKTAYNILQRNLKKANLPQRPFHALRATCVKMCQRKGWTVNETAKLLDDKVSTVQQHYATPSDEEMKRIAQEKKLL